VTTTQRYDRRREEKAAGIPHVHAYEKVENEYSISSSASNKSASSERDTPAELPADALKVHHRLPYCERDWLSIEDHGVRERDPT